MAYLTSQTDTITRVILGVPSRTGQKSSSLDNLETPPPVKLLDLKSVLKSELVLCFPW